MTMKVGRPRGRAAMPEEFRPGPFIRLHLEAQGEDYPANVFRLYKDQLKTRPLKKGGRRRLPTYHSFLALWHVLVQMGALEFTGKEEESDSPQFVAFTSSQPGVSQASKPLRRYYRLAKPMPPEAWLDARHYFYGHSES